MSGVQEVNIEHLLMNIPLPEDPLPSAEEIAGAKAAAAAAHSTCSAAAVPSQPVKGLGGAGLNLKRGKGGSKAGNSSTISAATAPPALLGRPAGSRAAAGVGGSNLGSKAGGTRAADAAPAAAADTAAAAAGASSSDKPSAAKSAAQVATPEGSRSMSKDAAGVRSFRTVLSPGSGDDDEEAGSDWETASQEDIKAAPSQPPASSSAGWGSSISGVLEDFADPSTLAFCGVVLGACATALLVLGANAWLKGRQ